MNFIIIFIYLPISGHSFLCHFSYVISLFHKDGLAFRSYHYVPHRTFGSILFLKEWTLRVGFVEIFVDILLNTVEFVLFFFSGLIYDEFGSFFPAMISMAVINALAIPPLLALAWMQRPK